MRTPGTLCSKEYPTGHGAGAALTRTPLRIVISPSNRLLEAASPDARNAILAAGAWNVLATGERLGAADTPLALIHFPISAVVGVAAEADGIACAVGSFSEDGFTGIPLLFGISTQLHTFIADRVGPVFTVPTQTVANALRDDAPFRTAAAAFVATIARQKASAVACTALHVVRQRLARRLLVLWERSDRPHELPIARSTIARFAGADHRTAARALRELQAEGAVTPHGSMLTINESARLRALACRCVEIDERMLGDERVSA